MSRLNWKGSAPYENILGKETGEKVYALMELLGVKEMYKALRFAVDFAHHELVEECQPKTTDDFGTAKRKVNDERRKNDIGLHA